MSALFSVSFPQSRLSAPINLLSSRPPTIPSPTYNGPNGYYNGGGPTKDYFSIDPRLSQQSHLSSALRPGSSRSTASPPMPHSPLFPQDDPDSFYSWGDQPQLSRADSARPPLPPKIPSQAPTITMPEPSLPTDDMYSSYPGSGGSNGAGPSVYRNDSASSYVLPPPPHKTFPLANPHTDSPSCKTPVFLRDNTI